MENWESACKMLEVGERYTYLHERRIKINVKRVTLKYALVVEGKSLYIVGCTQPAGKAFFEYFRGSYRVLCLSKMLLPDLLYLQDVQQLTV